MRFSVIIASIFECFGLIPVSFVGNSRQVRLVFEILYSFNFDANPFLSNFDTISLTFSLWLVIDQFETIKYH